jgi:Asp-tRNA(Asn)/Glu-tRNA(Gln) amidotransferase B subunit
VPLGDYFEKIAPSAKNPKAAANWIINNLRAKLAETGATLADLKFKPEYILDLVDLVESRKISSSIAQQVFAEMFASGEAPGAIVEKKGWAQVSDTGAIEAFAIRPSPRIPGRWRITNPARKAAALNFLKGQVMKLSKGKANPEPGREKFWKRRKLKEKIALFVGLDKEVTHAARQLPSGAWTSKLGDWEDIEHKTLSGLESACYGRVARILRRPVPEEVD